jgi:hypothetical protein
MKAAIFLALVEACVLAFGAHEPPNHENTEMHKGNCDSWETFMVELAFNRTEDGTVVIVGAHNHDNDFWKHLAKAKNLDKIFVEPLIPSMFHDFEKDLHALPKAKLINAAVTGTDSEKESIYCTGSKHPAHLVFNKDGSKKSRLLKEAKKASSSIATNIIQTCSLDKSRLQIIHDLDGNGASPVDISAQITTHTTKTMSIETLLANHVTTPLRMLQIDVEGADDKVINYPLFCFLSTSSLNYYFHF